MASQTSEAKNGNGAARDSLDLRVLSLRKQDFIPIIGGIRFAVRTADVACRLATEREDNKYASPEHASADVRLMLNGWILTAYNAAVAAAAYGAGAGLYEFCRRTLE